MRPYLWLAVGTLFLSVGACPGYFLIATATPGAKWLIVVIAVVPLIFAIKAYALAYTRLTNFTDDGLWVPSPRGRQLVRWSELECSRKRGRMVILYAGRRAIGVALEDFRDPEAVWEEIQRRLPLTDHT